MTTNETTRVIPTPNEMFAMGILAQVLGILQSGKDPETIAANAIETIKQALDRLIKE